MRDDERRHQRCRHPGKTGCLYSRTARLAPLLRSRVSNFPPSHDTTLHNPRIASNYRVIRNARGVWIQFQDWKAGRQRGGSACRKPGAALNEASGAAAAGAAARAAGRERGHRAEMEFYWALKRPMGKAHKAATVKHSDGPSSIHSLQRGQGVECTRRALPSICQFLE